MINFRLFIGCNDKDSHVQEYYTSYYFKTISENLEKFHIDSATLYEARGLYEKESEKTFIVEILIDNNDEKIKQNIILFINTIKKEFNQNCILVEKQDIQAEFI